MNIKFHATGINELSHYCVHEDAPKIRMCALSVVGWGVFRFLYLLLSDSDGDNEGPGYKKNTSQLGLMSSFCLDNVYMNYLQEKSKNPTKVVEGAKHKKTAKGRRKSLKVHTGTDKKGSTESNFLRRNSAPKVVVRRSSTDDLDSGGIPPKARGRRGSLQPGHLSPFPSPGGLLGLGGIQEDKQWDSNDSINSNTSARRSGRNSLTPSSSPRQNSEEKEADKASEKEETSSPQNEDDVKIDGIPNEKSNCGKKEEELLLTLIKKNVKESEFTPEQKALYDAHDTLWDEFQRRKAQRQKIGGLLRRKAKELRGVLAKVKNKSGESDLALKARSNDLQRQKRDIRKEKRRFSSYGQVNDKNKI